MTDSRPLFSADAFGPEPVADVRLGGTLRRVVGETPLGAVNWSELAERISGTVAMQMGAPWWSYATRWERRVVPLALAAGIAATFALLTMAPSSASSVASTSAQRTSASWLSTAVLSGKAPEDAASQFARSITNAVDFSEGIRE